MRNQLAMMGCFLFYGDGKGVIVSIRQGGVDGFDLHCLAEVIWAGFAGHGIDARLPRFADSNRI